MARAVDLLSRRDYSRRELEQRLRPHAESEEQLSALLEQLAERCWQSDQRCAEQFALSKGRQYGSLRLRHALREKGIASDTIDSALAQQNDLQTARALWRRKFGALPLSPQEKARQLRFLMARGFPSEVIRQVLAGALDDMDSWTED